MIYSNCPQVICSVIASGNMTAFTEMAWSPTRGNNNGKDMQWGGGTLFVSKDEKANTDTGKHGKKLLEKAHSFEFFLETL